MKKEEEQFEDIIDYGNEDGKYFCLDFFHNVLTLFIIHKVVTCLMRMNSKLQLKVETMTITNLICMWVYYRKFSWIQNSKN